MLFETRELLRRVQLRWVLHMVEQEFQVAIFALQPQRGVENGSVAVAIEIDDSYQTQSSAAVGSGSVWLPFWRACALSLANAPKLVCGLRFSLFAIQGNSVPFLEPASPMSSCVSVHGRLAQESLVLQIPSHQGTPFH